VRYRHLGKDGPRVSAVGLGRGSRPIEFGDPLEKDFASAVRGALDLGVNFFDTADNYWWHRHEVLLGRALKGRRSEALIASKFGNIDTADGRRGVDGRPQYAFECCDASLERLGVDVIDVYYLHRIDPNVPIEETVGAMARLVERGKVRWIGICEASPETIRRAHRTHPLCTVQSEFSLWARDRERDVLPVCGELGIGFVPYAPLGRGLLTGRIRRVDDLAPDDRRRNHPRFKPENLPRNVGLVAGLEAIAASIGSSAAQLALAWLLARGDNIVPIPGTNHVRNVAANAAAADLEPGPAVLERLNRLFVPGAGAGERSPAQSLKRSGL
jgi:aryl-alcohol dehydrogenase-like predicted oxidoreductase